MKKVDVVAIIQARGGSKGVPKKNIRLLGGFPLIAYSIAACRLADEIERTIVSTDSEDIAEISRQFGAEIPFLRPDEYARDNSMDIEVFKHAVQWFKHNEKFIPEYMVQIRPTTPLRDPELINKAVRKIKSTAESTGLVSVHEIRESPCKMFGIEDDFLIGLCPNDPRPEYYNLPRQAFPSVYFGNGYVDIVKSQTLIKYNSCYGRRMLGFIAPDTGEVDREEDFEKLEFNLSRNRYAIYEYLCKNYKKMKEGRTLPRKRAR